MARCPHDGRVEEILAARDRLERCKIEYALVADQSVRNSLRDRLSEAREKAQGLEKEDILAEGCNRSLSRTQRHDALLRYARLCAKADESSGAVGAYVVLRQEYADNRETMHEANAYLDKVLGTSDVPRQVDLLLQAKGYTQSMKLKLSLWEIHITGILPEQ